MELSVSFSEQLEHSDDKRAAEAVVIDVLAQKSANLPQDFSRVAFREIGQRQQIANLKRLQTRNKDAFDEYLEACLPKPNDFPTKPFYATFDEQENQIFIQEIMQGLEMNLKPKLILQKLGSPMCGPYLISKNSVLHIDGGSVCTSRFYPTGIWNAQVAPQDRIVEEAPRTKKNQCKLLRMKGPFWTNSEKLFEQSCREFVSHLRGVVSKTKSTHVVLQTPIGPIVGVDKTDDNADYSKDPVQEAFAHLLDELRDFPAEIFLQPGDGCVFASAGYPQAFNVNRESLGGVVLLQNPATLQIQGHTVLLTDLPYNQAKFLPYTGQEMKQDAARSPGWSASGSPILSQTSVKEQQEDRPQIKIHTKSPVSPSPQVIVKLEYPASQEPAEASVAQQDNQTYYQKAVGQLDKADTAVITGVAKAESEILQLRNKMFNTIAAAKMSHHILLQFPVPQKIYQEEHIDYSFKIAIFAAEPLAPTLIPDELLMTAHQPYPQACLFQTTGEAVELSMIMINKQ